jgi:hypothetical protein
MRLTAAGLSAKTAMEVGVALKSYEQVMFDCIATTTRAASRGARGMAEDEPPSALVETALSGW